MRPKFVEENYDEYLKRKNETSGVENDVFDDDDSLKSEYEYSLQSEYENLRVADEEVNNIMQSNSTVEKSSSHQQDSVPEKSVIDKSNTARAKSIQYRAAPVTTRRRSVRIQEKFTSLGEQQFANDTTEQPLPSNTKNARERKSKEAIRSTELVENIFADESNFVEVTLNYANRKRKRSEPKDTFSALVQQYFTDQSEMHIVVDDKVVKSTQRCATCTLCGESKQYQKSSVWNLRKHLETVKELTFCRL